MVSDLPQTGPEDAALNRGDIVRRSHPFLARAGTWTTLCVPSLILVLAGAAEAAEEGTPTSPGLIMAFALVMGSLLLLRRRWPLPVLLTTTGLATAQMIAPVWLSDVGGLAVAFAVYEVAVQADRPASVRASVFSGVALAASGPLSGRPEMAEIMVKTPIFVAVAYALGRASRLRAQHAAALEERAALVELNLATDRERAALVERQRLSRDLHDSVLQILFGANARAVAAGQRLAVPGGCDHRAVAEDLTQVVDLLERASGELRALVAGRRELAPSNLSLVLATTIDTVRRQTLSPAVPVVLEAPSRLPELPPGAGPDVAAIVREALRNALEHAEATRIVVRVDTCPLVIEVEDDGRGIGTADRPSGHFGLETMTERAVRLGGSLELDVPPGGGTVIRLRLDDQQASQPQAS